MTDAGSLQDLNDIVVPEAVAWWPPAPGWYTVIAVSVLVLLWLGFHALKSWRGNTYRRQALRELAAIRKRGGTAAGGIPLLLKRAALSAWPRAAIAGLYGADWYAFLDRTAPGGLFSEGAGEMLDRLSYAASGGWTPTGEEFSRLCNAAEHWLRQHSAKEA